MNLHLNFLYINIQAMKLHRIAYLTWHPFLARPPCGCPEGRWMKESSSKFPMEETGWEQTKNAHEPIF